MIVVHHLEDSRSQRVLWLLEELGLEYEVKRYERDRKTYAAPAALRRVHPLGKSPTVEVDGLVLIETGAIVEYLTAKADGRLVPGQPDILRYRQFLHYAEGSLMPPLLVLLVLKRLGILGRPARPTILRMLDNHFAWLDSELAGRDWFAGDSFSAADIMMSFPIEAGRQRAGSAENRPHLIAWLARIHGREAYRAALARGGPYAFSH